MATPDPSANDNVNLIADLIEELKNEDIQVQLNAIEKMSKIALALGPDRTRNELIPFLSHFTHYKDEVLESFAQQLGLFVPLVGGPEHAHLIVPPLENLIDLDNIPVRDKTLKSLKNIASQLSLKHLKNIFLPLVERLVSGNWFTLRCAACDVIIVCYQRLNPATKAELRNHFRNICQDETLKTRCYAATKLGEFAKIVEIEYLKSDLIPMYVTLAQDCEYFVRRSTVTACINIASLLSIEDLERLIMPTLRQYTNDKSWQVRQMFAEKLTDLERAVGQKITIKDLVPAFKELLRDSIDEVRNVAINRIRDFCRNIQQLYEENVIVIDALPYVKEQIFTNIHDYVNSILAEGHNLTL